MLGRTKVGRTGKRFPNHSRLARKAPLGLDLVHHGPARFVDEGGVQRRVLCENESQSHPCGSRSSSRVGVWTDGLRDADEWPTAVRWEPKGQGELVLILMVPCVAQRITNPARYRNVAIPVDIRKPKASLCFVMASQDPIPASEPSKSRGGRREPARPQQTADRKSSQISFGVSEVHSGGSPKLAMIDD